MTSPTTDLASGSLTPAGPRSPQRSVRVPQLLLSLLVVAVFALLAVWWQATTSSRTPVLALANDVVAGEPLSRADLTEVFVNSDVPINSESPEFVDVFVGVSPITDLEAGTIISTDLFRSSQGLGSDEAIVGLQVDADEAPSTLRQGDAVQVLVSGSGGEPQILSSEAVVEAVVRSTSGAAIVQLRMSVTDAQQVQLDASEVVLIEVSGSDETSLGE